MNYKLSVSHIFKKESKKLAKKHKSITQDLDKLFSALEDNPFIGEPLGKNCYKIRMAIGSKGKGKSGGARIVTCVKIVASTVVLLTIYDKSEISSTNDKELDLMLKEAGII